MDPAVDHVILQFGFSSDDALQRDLIGHVTLLAELHIIHSTYMGKITFDVSHHVTIIMG